MGTLRTSVIVDLAGNLQQQARRNGAALEQFSRKGRRNLGMLRRSTALLGDGVSKMGNRYTALLTGVGAVQTGRGVIDTEQQFARLGVQAQRSKEEMEGIKQKIFEVSQLPNIRINPDELTAAVAEIVEKTGDLDFAVDNLDNLALAIQATGANGGAIGGIAAEFQKMGITARKDVRESLDILTVQGKEGAFTLQNLAALGPRVVTAYTAMGRTGVPAIREMGAALQLIRQGTGNAEQAATSFEALLRTLGDADKVKKLEGAGLKIFDEEAAKKGLTVMRPINEIMAEIIEKTKGSKLLLSKVFDAEAIRAFNAAAGEYQRVGNLESLDKFMRVQADGNTILADSARIAKTAKANIQGLSSAWRQLADEKLLPVIQQMSEAIGGLSPDQQKTGLGVGTAAVVGASAAGAVVTAKRAGQKIVKTLRGAPPATATPAAPKPNGLSRALGARAPAAKVATRGRLLTRFGRFAGPAGAVLGAGAAGYAVGSVISDQFVQGTSFGDVLGGGIAKALAFFGNEEAQKAIALNNRNKTAVAAATESVEIGGTIKIEIDDKRVRVKAIEKTNDRVDFEVETGSLVGLM